MWIANIAAFAFLPAFVVFMNRFQITPEERALESLFGEDFKSYCANVRRWI
jgi:protein-S-isoprenylcysteine O-methyltransferase Ste14